MKVKIATLILVLAGAVGTVGATSMTTAPTANASQTTTATTQDRFDRPPHPSVLMAKKIPAVMKPHKAPVAHVKKAAARTHARTVSVAHRATHWSSGGGWSAAASVWAKYPSWVQQDALCVVHHESFSSGLWHAQNSSSSASGAYQYIDGTWRTWLARAGLSGPSRAVWASPVLQSQVFAYTVTHGGQGNWGPDGC